MAEARYRGQKVIAVAPDYADNVKFADEWLPAQPGTDGALAMAMGHVILKEFFVDRPVDYFTVVRQALHRPAVPRSRSTTPATARTGPASCSPPPTSTARRPPRSMRRSRRSCWTQSGEPVVPNGSLGFRYGDTGAGRWNLDLGDVDPLLSADRRRRRRGAALSALRHRVGRRRPDARGVPVRPVGGHLVTTVYDLLLAQYGVARDGLPGEWPTGYDDPTQPYTPAWQEAITGVPGPTAARIAREFAANAEESRGRSMIIMGAGTNHWFHSDTIYRSFLTLTTLTGCQGVNGGGWAHYVGQEKVRPITGYSVLGTASDWSRPGRQMIQTAYWYLHTDQYRYDPFSAATLATGQAGGQFAGRATADLIAASARMGWMPSYPQFNRNPLDLADDAAAAGVPLADVHRGRAESRAAALRRRGPGRAGELPAGADRVAGQPARLVGQGQRVLPAPSARHRPRGTRNRSAARGPAARGCRWREKAPDRKARPAAARWTSG